VLSLVAPAYHWRVMAISPDPAAPAPATGPTAVLGRGVERALASRQQALVGEVNQIIEATYRVISRTESLDPPLREILREAGLSTPAFYRHFHSKDELLVGLVELGWETLRGYLAHQMSKTDDPVDQIAAWVRGMLAQAADAEAARRARPFTVNEPRLATLFPDEHRASRDSLVALLVPPVEQLAPGGDPWPDARLAYFTVKAVQDDLLISRTRPSWDEADRLVAFVLAALARRHPVEPARGATSGAVRPVSAEGP
jgi:AcrR family transcriptional regulator